MPDSFAQRSRYRFQVAAFKKPSAFLADNGGEIRPLSAGVTPPKPVPVPSLRIQLIVILTEASGATEAEGRPLLSLPRHVVLLTSLNAAQPLLLILLD